MTAPEAPRDAAPPGCAARRRAAIWSTPASTRNRARGRQSVRPAGVGGGLLPRANHLDASRCARGTSPPPARRRSTPARAATCGPRRGCERPSSSRQDCFATRRPKPNSKATEGRAPPSDLDRLPVAAQRPPALKGGEVERESGYSGSPESWFAVREAATSLGRSLRMPFATPISAPPGQASSQRLREGVTRRLLPRALGVRLDKRGVDAAERSAGDDGEFGPRATGGRPPHASRPARRRGQPAAEPVAFLPGILRGEG